MEISELIPKEDPAEFRFRRKLGVRADLQMAVSDSLAELKRERIKIPLTFIGDDGKEYGSWESLQIANKAYSQEHFQFIATDGRRYSTMEQVKRANQLYWESQKIPRRNR